MSDLEKETGMDATALRVKLRNSDLEKEGARWGWNNKKDFDAAVKACKSEPKAKADKAAKGKGKKAKADA